MITIVMLMILMVMTELSIIVRGIAIITVGDEVNVIILLCSCTPITYSVTVIFLAHVLHDVNRQFESPLTE